jgi:hypothetical protein
MRKSSKKTKKPFPQYFTFSEEDIERYNEEEEIREIDRKIRKIKIEHKNQVKLYLEKKYKIIDFYFKN